MSRWNPLGLAVLCPLALVFAHSTPTAAAPIPRYGPVGDPDMPWRDALRNFIVGFQNPADFELTVGGALPGFDTPNDLYPGVTNGNFSTQAKRDIERAWLLQKGTEPVTRMLHIPPECFTGDYIEGVTTVPDHQQASADYVFAPAESPGAAGYGFLWAWDYSGNPYYQSQELLNRAAVVLALHLAMVDQMHKTQDNRHIENYVLAGEGGPLEIPVSGWTTNNQGVAHPPECVAGGCSYAQKRNESDLLALTLFNLASEYAFIQSGLPPGVQHTFNDALERLGNRLASWGPQYGQMNRTTPGASALFLIAKLTGSSQAMADYEDYTLTMLSPPLFDEAGYFRDDGGWDASYNNANLDHLGRLARQELEYGISTVHGDVIAALENMYRLKSHLTVVDPDLEWEFRYSPNHWNSRTSAGVVFGQGTKAASAFDGIRLGIDGAYADLQGLDPSDYERLSTGSLGTYQQTNGYTAEVHVDRLDDGVTATGASNSFAWNPGSSAPYEGVEPWQEHEIGYYRPGWSSAIDDPGAFGHWAQDLSDPLLDLYPVQRGQDGIEIIDDDFVWARRGAMSVMIHTGPVSAFENAKIPSSCNLNNGGCELDVSFLPAGFGGGMISYVHGDLTGAGLIGRRRTRYGQGGSPAVRAAFNDNWSQWWRWSLHTVWLRNEGGGLTQSGRILSPSTTVNPVYSGSTPVSVNVTVDGEIPTDNARFGSVLMAPVTYRRTFDMDDSGLHVHTSVGAAEDALLDAVETIPLNGIGYRYQGLHMQANQGIWEDDLVVTFTDLYGNTFDMLTMSESYVDDVVLVSYERLGGELFVEFETPQRVKLTDPYLHYTQYYDPSDADGSGGTQSFLRTRNLVIDLIGNGDSGISGWLMDTTVGYTLYTY